MALQLMRLRKAAGYKNRDDFAKRINVNKHTYRSWETESSVVSLEQACMLADALHCTLDELAGRDVPKEMYADPKQAVLNRLYKLLDSKSQETLTEIASSFVADPSRLASKSGQGAEVSQLKSEADSAHGERVAV